jgi:4-amino-4-deoxy-L-arabinose transferase-like glycosyltransferase
LTTPFADSGRATRPIAIAATFLAAALLFFSSLNIPLQEPDEVRYAEVPRQMLSGDSWLVPVLNGEPYLDKPPLTYWLVMASYEVFGVHDWSARLVASCAAFLTVVLTWRWATSMSGPRIGLATALVLTLTGRFVYLARMLTPDTILCLCTVAGWTGFQLAQSAPRLRWTWLIVSAIGTGLGVMTKGPVAVVLVLAPGLLLHLLPALRGCLRFSHLAVWLGIVIGVAAPWYLVVALREPVFLEHFFWRHNVTRFVAAFDHAEPFWFFLPGLILGTLPWCLALPAPGLKPARESASVRDHALLLPLLAFTWTVVFFSYSASKRAGYVLPAFPPLALMLGWACYRLSWRVPLYATAAAVFVTLLIGVHWLLPTYAARFSLREQVNANVADLGTDAPGVICFPRRWDSVSYYLRREDVRCYSSEQMADMYADLLGRPATLVFLKPGASFDLFVDNLPPTLEFERAGKDGLAIAGWVRRVNSR